MTVKIDDIVAALKRAGLDKATVTTDLATWHDDFFPCTGITLDGSANLEDSGIFLYRRDPNEWTLAVTDDINTGYKDFPVPYSADSSVFASWVARRVKEISRKHHYDLEGEG
jgi:hypothetical protein